MSIPLNLPQSVSVPLNLPQSVSIPLNPSQTPSISLNPSQSPSISLNPSQSPSISLNPSQSPSISLNLPQSVSISLNLPQSVSISLNPPQSVSISGSLKVSASRCRRPFSYRYNRPVRERTPTPQISSTREPQTERSQSQPDTLLLPKNGKQFNQEKNVKSMPSTNGHERPHYLQLNRQQLFKEPSA